MIKLYDGYQAKKANFETLDVGGYILRILNAKVEKKPASEWLVFSFDIAEGEHKDFYNKRYKENTNEDKKWGGTFWLRIPDSNSEYFGRQKADFENVMACIEESNNGYRFDGEEANLKGKFIGGVFGREEWEKNNGETAWSVKCRYFTDIASIRSGDYKIPKDKGLKNKTANNAPSSNFSALDDLDAELPFV